jgi:integrase
VAWIVKKASGKYLVRWRDLRGRTRSEQYDTLDDAEIMKDSHEREERRANPSRESVVQRLAGLPPSWLGLDSAPVPQYVFENYLRTLIESDKALRQTSRETYLHSLKNHIAGTPLGQADVRAITPEMVKEFWVELDVGVGALRNVYQLLAKAFNHALNVEGVISFSPLVRAGIKRPAKGRREEIVPLTVSEIERLAAAAMHPRDRAAILLMAYAGLRAGEVGGLRVQDVDFEKCRVSIRQQVVQTHREKSITSLKTRAARRTIEVACSVTAELKAFIEAEPPAADGRIFHGVRGDSDLWAYSKINRQVQKAAKAAELRPVHAHLLRHTAVSLLIDDGANPKAIQAFVGHSNVTETLQTYGHLFDYGGSALAASMEKRRDAFLNAKAAS